MRSHAIALVPLILLGPAAASAAIFKCVGTGGAVTYSGMPCPERAFTERVIEPPVGRGSPPSDRGEAARATEPGPAAVERLVDRSGGRAAERGRDGPGSPE